MSDVHTIGISSYWHLIDRYFAIIISIHHFYSITNYTTFIVNILLFLKGFQLLKRSQVLYKEHHKDFLLYHSMWHIIIFLMSITK
jgi:hypothetical protein